MFDLGWLVLSSVVRHTFPIVSGAASIFGAFLGLIALIVAVVQIGSARKAAIRAADSSLSAKRAAEQAIDRIESVSAVSVLGSIQDRIHVVIDLLRDGRIEAAAIRLQDLNIMMTRARKSSWGATVARNDTQWQSLVVLVVEILNAVSCQDQRGSSPSAKQTEAWKKELRRASSEVAEMVEVANRIAGGTHGNS